MAVISHITLGSNKAFARHLRYHQARVTRLRRWHGLLRTGHQICRCCAGVWEAINVLDAAYENNNDFQPRTLSIVVQDKPGVLNEVRES